LCYPFQILTKLLSSPSQIDVPYAKKSDLQPINQGVHPAITARNKINQLHVIHIQAHVLHLHCLTSLLDRKFEFQSPEETRMLRERLFSLPALVFRGAGYSTLSLGLCFKSTKVTKEKDQMG
jgi:hypothetical protein